MLLDFLIYYLDWHFKETTCVTSVVRARSGHSVLVRVKRRGSHGKTTRTVALSR